MRSEWVKTEVIEHILAALTYQNRLACEVSLATGLRIGDVLALKSSTIDAQRFTVKEEKTGKSRRVYLPRDLWVRLLAFRGRFYVFEGRTNPRKHLTRQAVYKDLRRAAEAFRVSAHVSPHSLRKVYAVNFFHKTGSLSKCAALLNHSSEAVTLIYAMADCVDAKRGRRVDKKPRS